jgi:aminopeptidase N
MKNLLTLLLFSCLHIELLAQTIDTKHIMLNLNFDWQKKQAFGSAEITFSTLTESDEIVLDAGLLTIQNISLNKQNLLFQYKVEANAKNLSIQLDRNYKPQEKVKIKIEYHTNYENKSDPNAISGSSGKGLRFQQPTSTTPTKRKQIWSSGEPEGNKYWFPCNEDITDIHSNEIYATVDKYMTVISNGNRLETTDNKNGTHTFHYKSASEFPNYLVSIVLGEYFNVQQQSGNTQINNFGYPIEKEAVKATVDVLPDMMKFLELKTAYVYPFNNYSQVVVQDYPFPGLVGQNSSSILSDNYIDDYGVHQEFKYLWDGVAIQALANQWFGNLLMPKTWQDIWLNNAFSHYFAGIYTAKCNSNAEYLLWYFPFEKGNVTADWEAGNKHPIVPEKIKNLTTFSSDSYSKLKGALILRMLQEEMGDENWWKTIQYYVKWNAHKQISSKDFQNAVELISGKSYQWFFDQWIYKMGLPELEISKNYNASQKEISITVKQIQSKTDSTDYPQVDYFEGKLKIEIDSKIKIVYLKPYSINTFTFKVNTIPSFVNFNYEESFLCLSKFSKSKEEYLAQLQNSKDFIAKFDALNQLVTIANDSTTNPAFKTKIRNAFISEVQSTQYWRYRILALTSLSKIVSLPYDKEMIALLKQIIEQEKYWLKSSAINILGKSTDPIFENIYINALQDKSDRVINSAAIALGKTKSPKAFDILLNLEKQKSWKNQNRISALNGLEQLGDTKALNYVLECIKDNQSPRWYLATPIWDYPFAAGNALVALGKADSGYTILIDRFKKSLDDNDINDIFQNVQLIDLLNDKRAVEMYALLKEKFKFETELMTIIDNYEKQYLENLKQ